MADVSVKIATTVETFDVCVIGAGIEGSAIAYTCAKHGLTTILLEQVRLLQYDSFFLSWT